MTYTPQIGDTVTARRKVPSKRYDNEVAGLVIATFNNACRVQTADTDWQLFYSVWKFERNER